MNINAVIFLDESGDLGWKFGSPYRHGGASRYLTIGAIIIPDNKKHLPARVVKKLYSKFKWNLKIEKNGHACPLKRENILQNLLFN